FTAGRLAEVAAETIPSAAPTGTTTTTIFSSSLLSTLEPLSLSSPDGLARQCTRGRVIRGMRRLPLLALAVVAAALPAASSARVGAALQNNTPPTISGSLHQGSTLTASNGTWSFTPDTFAYQWQRCDSDGSNCNDIRGATSATYTLAAADVSHTLAVDVTASNTFTVNDATSDPTDVVASANGPGADVQPAISGNAQIGQTLSVSTGSWNPPASSFAYQWQLCGGDGSDCLNVSGANKSTFAVTADDAAHTVRALVTAQTAA